MKVWRLRAFIHTIISWLIILAGGIGVSYFVLATHFSEIPLYYLMIYMALLIASLILFIIIIPKIRYRRWRYEIFEQEIYIQHGILIMTRTIVPMIRVQHVDTVQGPILKKYGLSTVTISTAATVHEIPALTDEDASALRDQISVLARVDEDDL